MESQKEID